MKSFREYRQQNIKGFSGNIEKETLGNDNYRKVLYTAPHSQIVLMSLLPNEEIGLEIHKGNDQFFRIEKGEGIATVNGIAHELSDGSAILVPSGSKHNIKNTSSTESLKLYTIYSPPHHRDGLIHKTKKEADGDKKDHFDGKVSN